MFVLLFSIAATGERFVLWQFVYLYMHICICHRCWVQVGLPWCSCCVASSGALCGIFVYVMLGMPTMHVTQAGYWLLFFQCLVHLNSLFRV